MQSVQMQPSWQTSGQIRHVSRGLQDGLRNMPPSFLRSSGRNGRSKSGSGSLLSASTLCLNLVAATLCVQTLKPRKRRSPVNFLSGSSSCGGILTCFASEADSDSSLSLSQLEEQLRVALQREDFTEAARLRDLLTERSFDAEAAVLCANREFYDAFKARDAERMASVWMDSEKSCCVHPSSAPIHGYAPIVKSFAEIMANGGGMDIEFSNTAVTLCSGAGRVVCREKVGDVSLVAVNLFEQTQDGWKLSYHQAGLLVEMPIPPIGFDPSGIR
eukprot:TRINITY_DN19349_c1_g1_i1.p1 TRINITY_DN19349_c1_g1~~TRINITY_DN19349_c1_g1_i1.p1  ORF type:complete len:273 (-),score=45.54 TRINITY_DN19349_c1_g1_i1:72-890(-)